MQKPQKAYLLNQLNTLSENHEVICECLAENDLEKVLSILVSCQEKAIALGEVIEKFEGEDCSCIKKLEGYCELLYNIHASLSAGKIPNPDEIKEKLLNAFEDIKSGFENDIKVKKEAVFLPYKASMWDSLESIWKKYDADPEWDAYVIPIPYFELNPEGQVSKRVYEGASFPKDVPVVSFKDYDFEHRRPDEIYIINPYDDRGFVTTVDPFFYTTNLKNFTDCLVYVPYFVLDEPVFNNLSYMENLKGFVLLPGVTNSNKVIVQSEKMREAYIKILVDKFGEKSREICEKRIFGTGSPKIEKILNAKISDYEIPADWEKKIVKPDGTRKKIVLYNTSLGAFLDNSELMIKKIERALEIFKENKDEITLLWRPHPLLISTISSMRPELLDDYMKIVNKYKADDFGIYDDSPDMDRALVLSDAYYGDRSSLVVLYEKIKKPIMIQNVNV